MSASENPKGKAPLTMKIKFKSANPSSLSSGIRWMSAGGIFIRTKEPQSVGTQLKFEFQLQDGARLSSVGARWFGIVSRSRASRLGARMGAFRQADTR